MKKYGLVIGLEWIGIIFYFILKVVGKLIYDDYLILMLLVDNVFVLVFWVKMRVFVDIIEFEGWEL